MNDLWRDVRYSLRMLRKSPIFTIFVLGTLALGIGANTTVFTIINTLILNPLPVKNSSELGALSATDTNHATFPISYADLKDYQARNRVFQTLASYSSNRMVTYQENGGSERLFQEFVTPEYFTTLGLTPARGRFLLPDDRLALVMSNGTWRTRFGAREDIIGQQMRLNGQVFTVVGVAPPSFIGVNSIFGPDVWIPAATAEILMPNEMQNALTDRGKAFFTGIGRYRPGVQPAQAQADLGAIAAALAREFPAVHEGQTVQVRWVRELLFASSGSGPSPMLLGSMVLLVVVGIVLLIACSNVANLLMARSASRRQEMAVRLAMGASRQRLVRQLLTESVILGLASGALGFFVGYAGLQVVFRQLPQAANFVTPKMDANVFAFALGISLLTALLFGTMPALKASKANVADTLKEEARTTGRSRRRVTVANVLVVGQVAFSFLLLVTAALFLRSIGRAYEMDPGFQTAHLAIFMTNPGQAGYGKPQTKAFYKSARERVAAIPGVAFAAWSSNLPLWARPVGGLELEGRQQRSKSDNVRAIVNTVGEDYFETAGVSLETGRAFNATDQENSAPVAIVNEKLARDYFPGGAIGKRVRLPGEKQMRQIVGIARTANYSAWGEAPQLCVYIPMEQNYSDGLTLFVRSHRDPKEILLPVQQEVRAVAPEVLVTSVRTGAEIVSGGLFQARMGVGLLTMFGLLALGLASIGLYGILAYSVNQRKREIGLRMAIGATPRSVMRMVLREGMSLVALGVVIGFLAALVVGRLLSGMLFGVSAADPASVIGATVTLSVIALVACFLPAYSATRVDPLGALREA